MLVLTRKSEEKIVIGKHEQDQIVITILKIQGGKVSLGIKANKEWEILRQELIEPRQKEAAAPIRELEETCVAD